MRATAANEPKQLLPRIRRAIENLGPWQSLALLALPTCIVEPMKLAAVAIAGEGHWFSGTAVIIAAYAASLLLVERLFVIVKPKLLKLHWFARLWCWLVVARCRMTRSFRSAR
ncbi:MAG TPA: hypothetical protein VFB02_24725 [Bradyrhizobium sp.]|jgi:hypothetical protein|nr:hypothetical protein [Bradyrhizobium sp.]